jgi:hypothetical protein
MSSSGTDPSPAELAFSFRNEMSAECFCISDETGTVPAKPSANLKWQQDKARFVMNTSCSFIVTDIVVLDSRLVSIRYLSSFSGQCYYSESKVQERHGSARSSKATATVEVSFSVSTLLRS